MEYLNETQLLHHCAQRGNERAWSELVQRFDSQLQMAVRRGLRRGGAKLSVDEVNEMVQEVYCRLLDNDSRHLRDFRGKCEMEAAAYLSRIAETVVRDQLRRQRALKRGGFHLAMRQVDLASLRVTRIDTRDCPERRAMARSQLHRLLERYRASAPQRLHDRNLKILRWSLLEGWTSREIAGALPEKPTVSSVNSLLFRLRRRLASLPTSSSLRRIRRDAALSDHTS